MLRIAFDLDDVICTRDSGIATADKYKTCKPVARYVKIVNDCFEAGHHVTIYTARGMSIFKGDVERINIELRQLTETHLRQWGVKYHELIMGKAHYDVLIDDKVMNSEDVSDLSGIEGFCADWKGTR